MVANDRGRLGGVIKGNLGASSNIWRLISSIDTLRTGRRVEGFTRIFTNGLEGEGS